jgi:hypothetical protein
MRAIRVLLVLCCALLAAGCGSLTTKYPIGTTAGLVSDTSLIGTWKGRFVDREIQKPDTPPFYLHFLKTKDSGMFALWVATGMDDGGAIPFKITTAKLGDNRYINAAEFNFEKTASGDGVGTMPLLYRLDDKNGLTLFAVSKDKLLKAAQDGGLAIETTHHKSTFYSYDNVEIVSDPAALDAFFAKPEAADLFEPWIVLKKAD